MTTLQAQLTESKRLLDLKSSELANLQKQMGQGKTAPTAPVAPAKSPQEVLREGPKPAAAPTNAAPAPAPQRRLQVPSRRNP